MFYLHLILLSVQLKHLHLHPPPCTHSRNITGGLFVYNRSVRPLITIQILPGMQRYVTGVKYIRDGIFYIYSYILLNSGDSVLSNVAFVLLRAASLPPCPSAVHVLPSVNILFPFLLPICSSLFIFFLSTSKQMLLATLYFPTYTCGAGPTLVKGQPGPSIYTA